jgi:hypothetical protein
MIPYLSVLAAVVALVVMAAGLDALDRLVPKGEAEPKLALKTQETATELAGETKPSASRVVFLLDSVLLSSLFRYCTSQGHNEVFTYICGLKVTPDRIVLQHIVPVAHAYQSPIGAQTEAVSTIGVHEMMDEVGVNIVAHCHSHPGKGPGAVQPSSVDRNYVAALAAGSSRLLGLIVSRDGYFRAYAHDGFDFEIELHGKCIHKESDDENLFHIDPRLGHGDLPLALFGAAGGAARAPSARQAARF